MVDYGLEMGIVKQPKVLYLKFLFPIVVIAIAELIEELKEYGFHFGMNDLLIYIPHKNNLHCNDSDPRDFLSLNHPRI